MTMQTLPRVPLVTLLTAAATVLLIPPIAAQDNAEPAASPLSIEAVTVLPADPGPDTLCKLRVKVTNRGTQTASQLGFSVKLNGQELGVYLNQLFMYPVEAGATAEIDLYNFWTTETSRSMPADAKLNVEVSLNEAVWMEIKTETETEGEEKTEVEVWTPQGEVPGLPVSNSVKLAMRKSK